ncbi:MAG: leucine-rich repeat domain-containing protein [Bacteroidales bacterium]|nr:leucine-rich repeat domain-containing protein [Bacteroidales bacterium]
MKRFVILLLFLSTTLCLFAQPDKVYRSLKDVRHPDSVYVLRLHFKRLRHIPPQVFTYRNLRVLDLSRNFIDSIPPQIATLTQLEELNLHRNRIRTVPAEVGRLSQLRKLNLSRNPILDLPDALSSLSQLEELVIWCTGIVSFPPSFVVLDQTLRLIDMRVCPMTYDDQQAVEALLPTPRKRWDYVCNCE